MYAIYFAQNIFGKKIYIARGFETPTFYFIFMKANKVDLLNDLYYYQMEFIVWSIFNENDDLLKNKNRNKASV